MKKAEPRFRLFLHVLVVLSDYAVPANPTCGLPFNHCIDTSSNRSEQARYRVE